MLYTDDELLNVSGYNEQLLLYIVFKTSKEGGAMANKVKRQEQIRRAGKTLEDLTIYWQLGACLLGSFVGLFAFYQVLEYFGIVLFPYIVTPWITFLLISIIFALGRYVVYLLKNMPKAGEQVQNVNEADDSLIEMLKDAEAHSRWAEIIKIGSALSDVLWFTSRKKLRLAIGGFVEVAATQLNDNKTLASTLIEDLGNTVMGLGYPDKGIAYIKRGIAIAEKHNYAFLVTRGYRNLANCYALKNDSVQSEKNLKNALDAANKIADTAQKLEALGGIEYARCKTLEHSSRYHNAIAALDASITYYTDLGNQFPETESRNRDRLVKVYREKGVIYLKMSRPDLAKEALLEGLRRAQETLNHDNIVRCCVLLVKIQLDDGEIQSAEGMLNIAKQHINKIDTPSIRTEYNDISRRFEIEKESQRQIGTQ